MEGTRHRRRTLGLAAAAAAGIVALGAGLAYGTNGSTGEVVTGCVKKDGLLRVVDSEAACRGGETSISWPAEGPRGYRIVRTAPPSTNVEITALGTGDVGFPAGGETETELFTFSLPEGVYFLGVTVGVFKNSGHGELLCYVRVPGGRTGFMRAALGTDPGYTRLATVHSDGVLNWPGGEAALVCIQAANVAGSPTGENPVVFYGTVNATKLGRATFTRMPEGQVVELP